MEQKTLHHAGGKEKGDGAFQGKQPLELEHLIGYTSKYLNSVKFHTHEKDTVVYTIGMVLAIADLKNPHKQRFLRGHDSPVCCFDISPCGKMVASGQEGSKRFKGDMAPVVIWSWAGKTLGQFPGLVGSVITIAFSPDSKYVAASGANKMLYIWSLESGDVVIAQKSEKIVTSIVWGPMSRGRSRRNPTYSLVTTPSPLFRYHILEFESRSMQYVLKTYPCQFPSRGLSRTYMSTIMDNLGESAISGTEAGDMLVFSMRNSVFRTRIPICASGISSVVKAKDNVVYLGGGDGSVKKLRGSDRDWQVLGETKIPGRIVSLSLNSDESCLVAGMAHGSMCILDTTSLKYKIAGESHMAGINDIAFGKKDSSYCCTISEDRLLRVWNLGNYHVQRTIKGQCAGRRCLIDSVRGEIISGWSNGAVRAFSIDTGRESWSIAKAHKGAITCLDIGQGNLLTGGEDGSVRIWSTPSCRLVTQYQAHQGAVGEVLADISQPHLVHSFGLSDRAISTYNAKKDQKIIAHMIQNGGFCSMTQRIDSEEELVTGLSHGYILFWDCDEKNPVGKVLDSGRSAITALALSPDGKYLALSGADYRLRVYEVKTMKLVARCGGHGGRVNRLRFSPDQRQIVSVGADAAVCVWNFYLSP